MRSIADEATLDVYDLMPLNTEIERILNDRPITALLSHPDDLSVITPAMIVIRSVVDYLPHRMFFSKQMYAKFSEKNTIFSRHILKRMLVSVSFATANKKKIVWHEF